MMRAFLGWLRREEGHCRRVAVHTAEQEDARRVTRERKGPRGSEVAYMCVLENKEYTSEWHEHWRYMNEV